MNKKMDDKLLSLIFTATRLIKERTAVYGNFSQISMLQCRIMSFVSEKETPTMKELAEFLYITSPSTTTITNRLVKSKDLERVYDKKDRRVIRLKLTAKGKIDLEKRRKEIFAKMSNVLKSLNEKEKKDFAVILTKIINTK